MIRLANKNDISAIIEMKIKGQKEAWDKEYNIDDKELKIAYNTFFLQHLNKDCIIFLKEIDKNIAAICILLIRANIPYCMDLSQQYGYITGVFTLSEYRKKGFQNELFCNLINYSKKIKLNVLELDSENPIAISMYKKYGFKIEDKKRVIMKFYLNE